MSKMIDYLKAAGGEASLLTRLGFWRQAVSLTVDQLVDLVQLISGGGLLPATGTTQGSRPLSGYNTALLQTGDEVFVQGINELYYFDATSALTADGLNVVNAVGPGQFIRSSTVVTQADWYVDSVNGDDENPGTAAAPLQTLPELFRRWSGKTLLSSIASATITLSGTFPAQVLSLTAFNLARGQTLVIASAALTTEASGTITTYTARNAAADASATILADISFAAHAGRRIRLTSGANSGAVACVLFDLGGNTCRVSSFSGSTGSAVSPANGDTFVIESYPTVVGGVTINHAGGGTFRIDDLEVQQQAIFQFNVLQPFGFISSGANWGLGSAFFNRCRFAGANAFACTGGAGFNACIFIAGVSLRLGRYYMQHGAFVGGGSPVGMFNSSLTIQAGYLCFEGCTSGTITMVENSSITQIADMQFFRCSGTTGISLRDASILSQTTGVFIFGGTNTYTNAMGILSGGAFTYFANKPTIVGSVPGTNDIKVGGTDYGWAAIPVVNAANNAMAVVRA